MNPEVSLVLGVAAIIALTVLGLAVVYRGGKMRATRDEVEVVSQPPSEG